MLLSFRRTPAWLQRPDLYASPYLLMARRRLERLAALDLSRPLPPPRFFSVGRRAEAHHWRLAEAWKRAQTALGEFERRLQTKAALYGNPGLPGAFTPESLRAILLTHYCANILRYQVALGKRPGVPTQPVPMEWMQMAAAAAMVSVIQTALMLWVMHRPPPRSMPARRRTAGPPPAAVVPQAFCAPRAVCLPLLL